ncbi:MAG: DEAD/DEAH box helicase [Treponema sp. CETP13]|nr:MAG: DEAD/DEAH box helicase [Treponema sp. CETP13]
MNYKELPVYEQKDRILKALETNQVVVVQSPTGSGKTTQLPVILHEAGYSKTGMIAVTQPRRIAALSVSEFIANQLGTSYPGVVGYKMRFEDKTDNTTKIKIMTDGILLQEMKLDPWLHKYSVIMVDEAHERSLNIDFVLGLLKRVLAERKHDFKVIVSSATMNAEAFSVYFNNCPIVNIETVTYPITMVYDPPAIPVSTINQAAAEALLAKIEDTVGRVLDNKENGDILIFLPGEKIIKDCIKSLNSASFGRRLHLVPLYGRLSKEEQNHVFDKAPFGRKKVVVSTNIAETSVTIPGITTVIDCGLAKLNYYNPKTFTSSLNETAVSKASCNQRKGRAGRIEPGTCYRLFSRNDFDNRPLYTLEEIYRTDLSEVVLRMAELGIQDFNDFDFISSPGREGIIGGIDTLELLGAINKDHTLSPIGKLMVKFPLMPRESRMIVESIMKYPNVIDQVLIAAAFLSARSPFILTPGEETESRHAHHAFNDIQGDFVSYVNLYKKYTKEKNRERFCKNNYLDGKVLAEIVNIKEQLEQIVVDIGIPLSNNGSKDDYLTCVAAGMIQFVCVRNGRENYSSLTAEHISIHPGSSMFRKNPLFIVAGEIVRTSRIFAMSVSPLTGKILERLGPNFESDLKNASSRKNRPMRIRKVQKTRENHKKELQSETTVTFGNQRFEIHKIKGKKHIILPLEKFLIAVEAETDQKFLETIGGLRGIVTIEQYTLLSGEKMSLIFNFAKELNFNILTEKDWNRRMNVNVFTDTDTLVNSLTWLLRLAVANKRTKELGFICLFTDEKGTYWFKVSRGISTAVNESIASLEILADEGADIFSEKQKLKVNAIYRQLTTIFNK